MKRFFKTIVAGILGWQLKRLRKRNKIFVIAVAGSIGKTSTKLAIAHVLSQAYKVQYQAGNYNDLVTVPLVFFGHREPNVFNPIGWAWTFLKNEFVVARKYPYQVVIVELAPDGPGQMKKFKRYLRADIGVLTAIVPEHMQVFKQIEAVAQEELVLAELSSRILANQDLVAEQYLARLPKASLTYGILKEADVRMIDIQFTGDEASFNIMYGGVSLLHGMHEKITEPQLYSICAAAAVATELEMSTPAIDQGVRSLQPVPGRMQHLKGLHGSTIIDDTYNASPEAMLGALNTLYRMDADQRIAILGNMNELGDFSASEHQKIGEYCDPHQLDFVATIGPDANKYLAPAAEKNGCLVKSFDNPVDAGKFVAERLHERTVVLAKGSQNGVFAEEAVKQILLEPADAKKLVRQSAYWLKTKKHAFHPAKK